MGKLAEEGREWNSGVLCPFCEEVNVLCNVLKHTEKFTVYGFRCGGCEEFGPWRALVKKAIGR